MTTNAVLPRQVLRSAVSDHQQTIARLRIVLQERQEARRFAVLLEMDIRNELRAELDALDDVLEALRELTRAERMERRTA